MDISRMIIILKKKLKKIMINHIKNIKKKILIN
jgi:hypothetical protein